MQHKQVLRSYLYRRGTCEAVVGIISLWAPQLVWFVLTVMAGAQLGNNSTCWLCLLALTLALGRALACAKGPWPRRSGRRSVRAVSLPLYGLLPPAATPQSTRQRTNCSAPLVASDQSEGIGLPNFSIGLSRFISELMRAATDCKSRQIH